MRSSRLHREAFNHEGGAGRRALVDAIMGDGIPGYDLKEVLGSGSYGVVYRANRTGEAGAAEFAVKQVSLIGVPAEERAKIQKETFLLRELHHSGIVRFVESHVGPSKLSIVTELCGGGDLSTYVSRLPGRRVPSSDVRRLARSVLEALDYLHPKGIIHRDIKPANILLVDDSLASVKLSDLGLSTSFSTLSERRTVAGTPLFMAPEVMIHEDDTPECAAAAYTTKADIWSLGVMLYSLAAGSDARPLPHRRAIKALAELPNAWRMPPLPPEVPVDLASVIQDMLTPDPSLRPDAAALLQVPALAWFVAGPPPRQPRVSPLASGDHALLHFPPAFVGMEDVVPVAGPRYSAPAFIDSSTASRHVHSAICNHVKVPKGPVWAAYTTGNVEKLLDALAAGGSTEETNYEDGETLLHAACRISDFDAVEELLNAGADYEAYDSSGFTPLLVAVKSGNTAIVRTLLKIADVSANMKGWTALHIAAFSGRSSMMSTLLSDDRFNVNAREHLGRTPAYVAACEGHAEVLRVLLDCPSIDVMLSAEGSSMNPLHIAVTKGHVSVSQMLVADSRMDVNALLKGYTALHFALLAGHAPVVKVLLGEKRIEPNAVGKWGCTPLHSAAENGFVEGVRVMLENPRVDVLAKDFRGRTALDMAREKGHTAVIALFTSRLPPSAYVGSTTRSADVDADLATALSLSLQAPLAGNSAARREELETAVGCLATVDVPGKSQLAAMTILTLCRNALLHPSEPKFRQVKILNAAFVGRVGSVPGGLEFMKAAGWQQDDAANALVLPATFDTSAMAEAVDILNQALSSGLFGNSLGP